MDSGFLQSADSVQLCMYSSVIISRTRYLSQTYVHLVVSPFGPEGESPRGARRMDVDESRDTKVSPNTTSGIDKDVDDDDGECVVERKQEWGEEVAVEIPRATGESGALVARWDP